MDTLYCSPTSFPFTVPLLLLLGTNHCLSDKNVTGEVLVKHALGLEMQRPCSYATSSSRGAETPSNDSREDTLMAQIDYLEQLSVSVMARRPQTQQPGAIDTLQYTALPNSSSENLGSEIKFNGSSDTMKGPEFSQLAGALGIVHVDQAQSKSVCISGAHWLSIMCQVSLQAQSRILSLPSRINSSQ